MMSDDRRKPGFRLNGRTDAKIEATANARAVAELSAQGFFFDDVNPVEVAERLAKNAAGGARRRAGGISGGKMDSARSTATARAWT